MGYLDIQTVGYRAPEIMFGCDLFGPPADMWGLGVTVLEAAGGFNFRSLKKTTSLVSYRHQMFAFLGPVDTDFTEWPTFPRPPPAPARSKIEDATAAKLTEDGVDFVGRLLLWAPAARLSAAEAQKHAFADPSVFPRGGQLEALSVAAS